MKEGTKREGEERGRGTREKRGGKQERWGWRRTESRMLQRPRSTLRIQARKMFMQVLEDLVRPTHIYSSSPQLLLSPFSLFQFPIALVASILVIKCSPNSHRGPVSKLVSGANRAGLEAVMCGTAPRLAHDLADLADLELLYCVLGIAYDRRPVERQVKVQIASRLSISDSLSLVLGDHGIRAG